ncbi:MAG: transglycosylase SLT domain-containing protein [Beijerinckiaceae bacterium]
MMRIALTLAVVFAGSAAVAQELPPAQEYPAVFETGPDKTVKPRPATRQQKRGRAAVAPSPHIAALVSKHASANGVPADLAHRVIMRESRYNPSARNRAYWGLMQISHATARGVGYRGPAQGLLDPDTNLRYGMAYLGNAYRVAGGDQRRAMKLYASGFYYEAKRKGMLNQMKRPDDASQVATR